MLEFVAFDDLSPYPNDMPDDHRLLGSLSLAEYGHCHEFVEPCFAAVDIEFTFFNDWLIPIDAQPQLAACLSKLMCSATGPALSAVRSLHTILKRAKGAKVLAVCD